MNTLRLIFFVYLIILTSGTALAEDTDLSLELLINNLNNYFQAYYSQLTKGGVINPKTEVLEDIKEIAFNYTKIDNKLLSHADSPDELSTIFDDYLRDYGKSIVLFTVGDSEIVNCWLGNLIEEKVETKNVWNREIQYTLRVLGELAIQDFTYFSSGGKDALDAGTRSGFIYYNLDAYRSRAASIWDFFAQKDKKKRRYDPSKSNRLRKKLYNKTWLNLYTGCIKDSPNLEEAKKRFIDKAVIALKENSLCHEAGHIFADRYLKLNDEVKEEMLAFLSELRYGPLPYESLETIIAASYKSSMVSYNLAGRQIIAEFLSFIRNEQKNGNPDYKDINIQGRNQIEKINNLYKLSGIEIRAISEYIYEQKRN